VGDTDYVTVPVEGMIDKDYLAKRAALIGEKDIDGPASPGEIPGFDPTGPADKRTKTSGTSHISIADRYGNVLSMTTTVESFFGNGVMVPGWGFLLNNQITDFSFDPGTKEEPIANRVQPNKRPRSSMSPTIILDAHGMPFLATGSPGGSRIIGYVLNTITGIIDFGLDPQEVINNPHYLNRNGMTELEANKPGINVEYDIDGLTMALEARGHDVTVIGGETSGLSLIQFVDGMFIGGADKRRDGTVGGSDYDTTAAKGKGGFAMSSSSMSYKGKGGATMSSSMSYKGKGGSTMSTPSMSYKGKGGTTMSMSYKGKGGSTMSSSSMSYKGKGGSTMSSSSMSYKGKGMTMMMVMGKGKGKGAS